MDQKFVNAVQSGDVSKVSELLRIQDLDVNMCDKDYNGGVVFNTLPLFIALKNINHKGDNFYQIASLLLQLKCIDVNKGNVVTILGKLCFIECATTLGIVLLLQHKRIKVNKGEYPPLYYACRHIQYEEDYFYKVMKLLLQRSDIDVNANCGNNVNRLTGVPLFIYWKNVICFGRSSVLCKLCENGCKSPLGVKMLLERKEINVNKGDPANVAAMSGHLDLFLFVINHRKYKIGHPYTLFHFLRRASGETSCFKSSKVTIDTIELIIAKGTNLNEPPALLAHAINFLPLDVCRILLEKGANVNSSFRPISICIIGVRRYVTHGYETALHAAARMLSENKVELLIQHRANTKLQWMHETYLQLREKYINCNTLYTVSAKSKNVFVAEQLDMVKTCREFLRSRETHALAKAVSELMKNISNEVSICLKEQFTCKISGSMLENTKCFLPNEFDYVFYTRASMKNDYQKGIKTYYCIDSLIRSNHLSTQSSDPRLQLVCLCFGDKISHLRLKWSGNDFENLDIKVDIAVCNFSIISKYSRFMEDICTRICHQIVSYPMHENYQVNTLMDGLKPHEKQGFILAKAVRIASIAQPDNLNSFDLEEKINIDDVITSFLLRMCLPNEKDNTDEFKECSTPHAVALKIYEILCQSLKSRHLQSKLLNTEIYFCKNIYNCSFERGCCKRRRFMIAIVEKIIIFLQTYERYLNGIYFLDNIRLDFGDCGFSQDETFEMFYRSLEKQWLYVEDDSVT